MQQAVFLSGAPVWFRSPQNSRSRRTARRSAVAVPPRAFLNLFRGGGGAGAGTKQQQQQSAAQRAAVQRLLSLVEGTERGLDTTKERRQQILAAAAELAELGSGRTTTGPRELSATWRLLWTTEKETLFILEKAGVFGTAAGEVYQVIDVEGAYLQNVITFPPEGAFIVDSAIDISGPQRTDFQFRAATLKLPAGRSLKLPPFGKGWFDTVYVDSSIRVAQDSRGDTLVVARDGPPRRFE